jgi:hypothetical protein
MPTAPACLRLPQQSQLKHMIADRKRWNSWPGGG